MRKRRDPAPDVSLALALALAASDAKGACATGVTVFDSRALSSLEFTPYAQYGPR